MFKQEREEGRKVKITKCDRCGEVVSMYDFLPEGTATWKEKYESYPWQMELCRKCAKEFGSLWKTFFHKEPPQEVLSSDDDSTNLATDVWGGAGPDCLSGPG
jgi:hypothetical protein